MVARVGSGDNEKSGKESVRERKSNVAESGYAMKPCLWNITFLCPCSSLISQRLKGEAVWGQADVSCVQI